MIKIVAVDDIRENLTVIEDIISSFLPDAEIRTFQSGHKAFQSILTDHPDTIILDISMPELDGETLCKMIKEEPSTSNIPVIMMSGTYAEKKYRIRALNIGADGYLAKPLDKSDVIAQVRAMLRIKSIEDAMLRKNNQLRTLIEEKNNLLKQKSIQLHKFAERTRMAIWCYQPEEPFAVNLSEEQLLEKVADLRCVVCNKAYATLVGKSQEEIESLRLADIHPITPEVNRLITQIIRSLLSPDEEISYEEVIDGVLRFFTISYVVTIKDGVFYEIWGTQSEITRKVALEKALCNTEQQDRTTVNAIDDMIHVIDRSYTIILANEQVIKMSRINNLNANPVGRNLFQQFPHLTDSVKEEYEEVFEKGIIFHSREMTTIDGKDHFTETRKIPCFEGNQVTGIVTVIRNITETLHEKLMKTILYDIARAANITDDLDTLFDTIRESLSRTMNTDHFHAVLYDIETDQVRLEFDSEILDQNGSAPAGKTLVAYVLHTRKPLLATPEVQKQLLAEGHLDEHHTIVKSWLGVPLIAKGTIIGALVVQDYFKANIYSAHDMEVLEFVADEISLAIDRKRAQNKINGLLKKQIAVNNIAMLLSRFTEANAMLTEVYRHITRFLDVSSFSVSLYNKDTKRFRVIYISILGKEITTDDIPEIPLGTGPQSRVIKSGKPLNIVDYKAEVLSNVSFFRWKTEDGRTLKNRDFDHQSSQSAALIPLKKENRPIGVLQVQSIRKKAYSSDDIAFLSEVSTIVAIALDNALLFEKLQKQINDRIQIEARLRHSLDEKNVMLQEIHHRVKNNLQIIASMLKLQLQQTTHPITCSVLRESLGRVKSMSLVHERLYKESNYSSIDFQGYFNGLTRQIRSLFKDKMRSITIETDLTNITLDMDQAIPCGLIINELVTNAIKHGFEVDQKGNIRVSLSMKDSWYYLKVKDTGVGLPPDFTIGAQRTLGMELVTALTSQLHGSIEATSHQGACFLLRFPVNKR